MKITLILVGKTRENYLQQGLDGYVNRLRHYMPFKLHVLPEHKRSGKEDIQRVKNEEGKKILKAVRDSDYLVLLDERGKSLSSEELAHYLSNKEGRTGSLVFVAGGAYGFSEEVYARAREKISLSRMTFSHQMVRLIFTEQLYRACTILKNEPYHHK